MDARQKAFDHFFAAWLELNPSLHIKGGDKARAVYAAGWNAALDWAAKQIQGASHDE